MNVTPGGTPVVKSSRDVLHFTRSLTVITVAVVGVVTSLAVLFVSTAFGRPDSRSV